MAGPDGTAHPTGNPTHPNFLQLAGILRCVVDMPWNHSLFNVPLRRLIATFGALVAERFYQALVSVVLAPVRSIKLCCGGVLRGSSTIRCCGKGLAMESDHLAFELNPHPPHHDFHS